jgi:hypothetical protein
VFCRPPGARVVAGQCHSHASGAAACAGYRRTPPRRRLARARRVVALWPPEAVVRCGLRLLYGEWMAVLRLPAINLSSAGPTVRGQASQRNSRRGERNRGLSAGPLIQRGPSERRIIFGPSVDVRCIRGRSPSAGKTSRTASSSRLSSSPRFPLSGPIPPRHQLLGTHRTHGRFGNRRWPYAADL